MNKLIILEGPSAVGKTTLADFMINSGVRVELVRSVTTRPPRGDGHDAEYIYLTEEEFKRTKEGGGMLESTEYADALYGTPASEIERISSDGNIPLLILDIDGVKSIKSLDKYPSLAVYLFDGVNVLEERLYARYLGENPSIEGLSRFVKRKERNLYEFANIDTLSEPFDMILDNSSLEAATKSLLFAYEFGATEAEKQSSVQAIKEMVEQSKKN